MPWNKVWESVLERGEGRGIYFYFPSFSRFLGIKDHPVGHQVPPHFQVVLPRFSRKSDPKPRSVHCLRGRVEVAASAFVDWIGLELCANIAMDHLGCILEALQKPKVRASRKRGAAVLDCPSGGVSGADGGNHLGLSRSGEILKLHEKKTKSPIIILEKRTKVQEEKQNQTSCFVVAVLTCRIKTKSGLSKRLSLEVIAMEGKGQLQCGELLDHKVCKGVRS